MLSRLRRHRPTHPSGDEGAAATEYAILLVALVAGSVVLLFFMLALTKGIYGDTCESVGKGGVTGAPTACP